MTRRTSPRLRAYLLIGAAGLFAGAASGRPEPVILVAPILIAALLGLLVAREPEVSVTVAADRDRLLEGEDVELDVRLESPTRIDWLDLALSVPDGLVARAEDRVVGLRLDARRELHRSIRLASPRWGAYRVGEVAIRVRDRLGFFSYETLVGAAETVRVFPRPAAVRRAIRPVETQAFAGEEVSARHGDGIEFAGVRPYAPGDQVRRVNWRLSSRRPELHVNEMHPERSTEVVIFLDTFTDLGSGGQSSLAAAVRGANGIADHYLRRRDRVGLIGFGGSIRWLVPGMGLAQSYRILDVLLDARAAGSIVPKRVDLVPPGSLPPKALVIALTPMIDDAVLEALLDLRWRRFDVAVIEIRPEAHVPAPVDAIAATARRLWQLQRELMRDSLRRLGVAVAPWSATEPLEAALEEVRAFRRRGRSSPA